MAFQFWRLYKDSTTISVRTHFFFLFCSLCLRIRCFSRRVFVQKSIPQSSQMKLRIGCLTETCSCRVFSLSNAAEHLEQLNKCKEWIRICLWRLNLELKAFAQIVHSWSVGVSSTSTKDPSRAGDTTSASFGSSSARKESSKASSSASIISSSLKTK